MNVLEELSHLQDSLGYVELYAPDFPPEDRTSLAAEQQRITTQFSVLLPLVPAGPRRDWLLLVERELAAAFVDSAASRSFLRQLQDARHHLRLAIEGAPPATDFVAAPSGVIILQPPSAA